MRVEPRLPENQKFVEPISEKPAPDNPGSFGVALHGEPSLGAYPTDVCQMNCQYYRRWQCSDPGKKPELLSVDFKRTIENLAQVHGTQSRLH
jgi:hypothetical protein